MYRTVSGNNVKERGDTNIVRIINKLCFLDTNRHRRWTIESELSGYIISPTFTSEFTLQCEIIKSIFIGFLGIKL